MLSWFKYKQWNENSLHSQDHRKRSSGQVRGTTKQNTNTQFPTEWRNRLAVLEIRKISASIWFQLGLDNYHWPAAVLYLNLCNQFASTEETKRASPAATRVTQHSYHLTTDRIVCPICQLLWVNTRLGSHVHPRWMSLLASLVLSQQSK